VVKQVYLIRHGQSEGNAEGRAQGWLDSPLSERGRQQALCLAQRLSTTAEFAALFTSTLMRAVQTAHIIGDRLNCPLNFEDDLREYNMGPVTGLTFEEIREQFPGRHQAYERNEPLPHLPGAECELAFLDRVERCLDRILQQIPDNRSALVVSHSGTLNACLRNWLGLPNHNRRPFKFFNASISVVEITSVNKRIIRLNDTCHLESLEKTEG